MIGIKKPTKLEREIEFVEKQIKRLKQNYYDDFAASKTMATLTAELLKLEERQRRLEGK